MTTIAADAKQGVMVCDSKCTYGETWFPIQKVIRHREELIGYAGDVDQAFAWIDWYTKGKIGKPPRADGVEILILRKNGLFYATGCNESRVPRGFHAIGSGGAAAVAGMLHGATVQRSVKIAIQVDAQSGGAVRTHRLNKAKKRKGKQ